MAVERARQLLEHHRASNNPVVHVRHLNNEGSPLFAPGSIGAEIHPYVAPVNGETVIAKRWPNSFLDTTLEEVLLATGSRELIIIGMMSSVDATVREAVDRGFVVTVVDDACAAPDLSFRGAQIPANTVHASFMAALASGIAKVASVNTLVNLVAP